MCQAQLVKLDTAKKKKCGSSKIVNNGKIWSHLLKSYY